MDLFYARKRDYRTEELQRLENYSIVKQRFSSFKTSDLLGSSYDWLLRYSLCFRWGGWRYGSLCRKSLPSRSKWTYDKRLREPILLSGRIKNRRRNRFYKRKDRDRFKGRRKKELRIPPLLNFVVDLPPILTEENRSVPKARFTPDIRSISDKLLALPIENQQSAGKAISKAEDFMLISKIPRLVYKGSPRALLKSA